MGQEFSAGASDEELVAALRGGDRDSLGTLARRWERPLYRFVFRMLPRSEDAWDICQETFVRILEKSDRFDPRSRFSTWMYQIALNLCRDQLRKRRRWSLILRDDREFDEQLGSSMESTGDSPEAEAGKREAGVAVTAALREIPSEQREVLVLKEFEGLKFREIAEILDCPESTVKSRLYYGLTALRNALAKRGVHSA